jgi:hypothetical protein
VKRSSLSLPDVLDDAFALTVSVASPWMGVLWLTALPLRFLQVHLAARVFDLGAEAGSTVPILLRVGALTMLAFCSPLGSRLFAPTGLALRS